MTPFVTGMRTDGRSSERRGTIAQSKEVGSALRARGGSGVGRRQGEVGGRSERAEKEGDGENARGAVLLLIEILRGPS